MPAPSAIILRDHLRKYNSLYNEKNANAATIEIKKCKPVPLESGQVNDVLRLFCKLCYQVVPTCN